MTVSPEEENNLVRAYLGDEAAMAALPWAAGAAEAEALRPRVEAALMDKELNEAQKKAICLAIAGPVTIIQGPPGTGKSRTIANLLACIHALFPERTAAMVSSNNSAVDNVAEKLMEWKEKRGDRGRDLWDSFSYLGSRARRDYWLERVLNEQRYTDRKNSPDEEYLRRRPLFTSTIHSLKRCFTEVTQFDYVIIDECSQVSCLLGLIAMGCARRLVLLGDPMQLPAVITEEHADLRAEFPDVDPVYLDKEGYSFLEACRTLFPQAPFVLLNEHFRCPPAIAGFINRYYDGKLICKTPPQGGSPIHIRWYEGDYWEEQGKAKTPDRGRTFDGFDWENCRVRYNNAAGGRNKDRQAYVNERQIAIFLREEWPELAARIRADGSLTACVLSPYAYPLYRLQQRLRELGAETELEEGDPEENTLPQLTVNKAQGREYDLVYYLPVEDVGRRDRWPWSQDKHLVNVAVSRAMREFRLILSACWLPAEYQRQELGYAQELRHPEDGDGENQLQLAALVRYAMDLGFTPVRSEIRSLFDAVPWRRRMLGENAADSAPARCLEAALARLMPPGCRVRRELPLAELVPPEKQNVEEEENGEALLSFLRFPDTKVDFVLYQGETPFCAIEVDGGHHRKDPRQKERDEKKNYWLKKALGEDGFLRLPTDGTTENEEERIVRVMEERGIAVPERGTVRDQPMERLWSTIAGCTGELREWCRTEDGYNLERLEKLAKANNYREAAQGAEEGRFTYGDQALDEFYYCRYGAAYANEYAQLYRELLKDYIGRGNETQLGVYSLGCGSMLDAWSLVYARADLACTDPNLAARCADTALYWTGVDRTDWPVKIIEPGRIIGADAPGDQQDALCGYYRKMTAILGEEQGDVVNFIQGQHGLYNGVLMFPKLLNELGPEVVDILAAAIDRVKLPRDTYYLCVSHSQSRIGAGLRAVQKLLQVFRRRGFRPTDVLAESGSPMLREDMEPRSIEDLLEDAAARLVNGLRKDYQMKDWIEDEIGWGPGDALSEAINMEQDEERKAAIRDIVHNAMTDDDPFVCGVLFSFLCHREQRANPDNEFLRELYRDTEFRVRLETWEETRRSVVPLPPAYLPRTGVNRYIWDRDPCFSDRRLQGARDLIVELGDALKRLQAARGDTDEQEEKPKIRASIVKHNNMAFQLIRLDRSNDLPEG